MTAGPYIGAGSPDDELVPFPEDDPPLDPVPLEDAPPLDDAPPLLDVPPDAEDDDELLVSSLPPHAAIAVAPAKRRAARVATRPCAAITGANAGSCASQNGHVASLARTCL